MRFLRLALLLALAGSPAWAAEPAPLEEVLTAADSAHWRSRWAAVKELARRGHGEGVFAIRPLLIRDKRPRVRSAVAWACVLAPDLGNATLLGIALKKDADPGVRFAAAHALVHHDDRRAVDALVLALAAEEEPRVRLRIVSTLRSLTPAPCLLDAVAWKTWWDKSRKDPRFQPADEAPKKGSYEGVVLETRSVAVVRKKGERRGPPPHVLILPPFGWSTQIYGANLLPLRRHANLTYVRLPSVQTLTGRSGYGKDIPVYPVDRLVRALDRYRTSMKIESFLVLAPGASGWIAMRYAQLYPERVRGLMLLDTALDKQAYVGALQRGSARGNRGEKFVANTLMQRNNAPFSRGTLDKLHTIGLESGFHDRADLEIAHLWNYAREPQGFATVPDIRWGKRARLDVPALFLYSASSPFSGHTEMFRIQKHFPKSMVTPISGARALPYVEENGKFHEIVDAFLAKYELK
ncbi:MAG: hypothetical protein ACYTGZ_08110 [Planctomycetota bacterium]|jgi:pimeloyl-ACP methyl ester carboxylesterase